MKDNNFSEIVEYLDGKFKKIDESFIKLPSIFVTKEDLKEATERLPTKEDFNNLLTAVDAYAHKADAYFQEMVALSHKVDRHEKWLWEIAEKLGIKLKYWDNFSYLKLIHSRPIAGLFFLYYY